MDNYQDKINRHRKDYADPDFWTKLQRFACKMGLQVVYAALLMYYAYRNPKTPFWAKQIILGTLGYLIAPIDGIPDLTPFLGYTDDLGVLSFGLMTIAIHIDEQVRDQAQQRLSDWFGDVEDDDLARIDDRLRSD